MVSCNSEKIPIRLREKPVLISWHSITSDTFACLYYIWLVLHKSDNNSCHLSTLHYHFRITLSKHSEFPEGKIVAGPFGWMTHAISKGYGVNILPDFGELPVSYGLGVLGMTG